MSDEGPNVGCKAAYSAVPCSASECRPWKWTTAIPFSRASPYYHFMHNSGKKNSKCVAAFRMWFLQLVLQYGGSNVFTGCYSWCSSFQSCQYLLCAGGSICFLLVKNKPILIRSESTGVDKNSRIEWSALLPQPELNERRPRGRNSGNASAALSFLYCVLSKTCSFHRKFHTLEPRNDHWYSFRWRQKCLEWPQRVQT